jgi:glycosyltransferase involved in cell wall biosynthesis
MRVAIVIYGSLDTATGGYLYDRQLVDFLRAHGDTVEVVSLPPRTYAGALRDSVLPTHTRRLADARVDVVLEDELCHPSLLRSRRRCPVVTVIHLLRSDERRHAALHGLYAALERRYLTGVDAAVFNSDATRASAEQLVGHSIPGVVARPAADHLKAPDATAATPHRDGPLRVISVANVVRGKGALTLIDAMVRLPAASWHLTIAGSLTADPKFVARLRRRIAEAGIGARVDLLGEIPNADVPTHLARHDVFALPSSYEAAGIASLEAMRMGLPVIATTAGGASEMITDGVEGFLVDPDDVDALSASLHRWTADRDLVMRMGLAARRGAEGHPTWAQSLAPVRDLLMSLVRSRQERVGQGSGS